ncbi:MAG: threonylcarbamoyl-AMP synthase, partial [Candidatus Dadabacteria bacterium]|nr:threonylcarbamoyl-AMP synthase [Candidatus Dadabacteria bacterium]
VIAYPTDTIYGIGCDIFQKGAVERLYRIKGKDPNKPLSFLCPNLTDISTYAQVGNQAFNIMKRLVPGPYTFILEASRNVPKIMLTRHKTVGIRIPNNAICLMMVQLLGNPIITTSVKNTENELFNDAEEIAERLGGLVDMVIDGGRIVAHHSTIIDLSGAAPTVIREGKGDTSIIFEE